MKYPLFQEIVLMIDIPEKGLKKGDIATIVDYHPATSSEDGYSLEVFSALGETIAIVTVPESAISMISANEVLSVRSFIAAP